LQRKIPRHRIAEITLGSGTNRSNDRGRTFVVGDDGDCCLSTQGMQDLYFTEDLVLGRSADTINQDVAFVALNKPRVGFVRIERVNSTFSFAAQELKSSLRERVERPLHQQ